MRLLAHQIHYYLMKIRPPTLLIIILIASVASQCNHPIFCSEPILQAIAKSNLFPDSKTFVDLVLKVPVKTALSNFLSKNVSQFVRLSFHPDPNIILQNSTFDDFPQTLPFLSKIKDPKLKQFAQDLHQRWNQLGKKVVLSNAEKVGTCRSECSTFLEQADGRKIVVPGGRFRESYYWDTYWIILGLIASDMLDTAQGILQTFAAVLEQRGFIPNGLRHYYLNRSQPPFFFLMLRQVANAHNQKGNPQRALQLQRKYFETLRKENAYWESTHATTVQIGGTNFKVNQYRANTTTARPESFSQDSVTVANITDLSEKKRVLQCLSSMAQSGWDFSSRWLDTSSLSSTVIDKIIPSDLNALLGLQESYLALLSYKLGYEQLVQGYVDRLNERIRYFQKIKSYGRYPDFRMDRPQQTPKSVYPSDFLPFILTAENPSIFYKDLVNPASSQLRTGQQWDSPNVWAPNNWIIHEVASFGQGVPFAKQWIKTTYCGWRKTGNLYEKYRNDAFGERGEGGEYVVQTGFGWTNGLALHYLSLYGENYLVGQC